MWATDKQFVDIPPGNEQVQQIGRVDFGRPETWSFFMAFRCNAASGPAIAGSIICNFDLFLGTGRSAIEIRNFFTFTVNVPNLSNPATGPLLWTTQTLSTQPTFPAAGNPLPVDSVVAQSINCSARVSVVSADPIVRMTGTATAFFSPRTHIRPEWFKGGTFNGSEDKGT